jgi:hypothetical protein
VPLAKSQAKLDQKKDSSDGSEVLSLNDRRILTYQPTTKNFRIMAVGFDEDVLDFLVTKRIFDSIALAGS